MNKIKQFFAPCMELVTGAEIRDTFSRSYSLSSVIFWRQLKAVALFLLGMVGVAAGAWVLMSALGFFDDGASYSLDFELKTFNPLLGIGANIAGLVAIAVLALVWVTAFVLIPRAPEGESIRGYVFKTWRSHYHVLCVAPLVFFMPFAGWVLGLAFFVPSLFPLFVFFDNPPSYNSVLASLIEGWYLWIKFLPFWAVVTLLGLLALVFPLLILLVAGLLCGSLTLVANKAVGLFFTVLLMGFAYYWIWRIALLTVATPFVTYAKIKERFPDLVTDSQA